MELMNGKCSMKHEVEVESNDVNLTVGARCTEEIWGSFSDPVARVRRDPLRLRHST